jgi:hypothetical protein
MTFVHSGKYLEKHKNAGIITPAIKYLKVVIPRPWLPLAPPKAGKLDRSPRRLAWCEGIQKELDTPIKAEYDMFFFLIAAVIKNRRC